MNSPSESTHRSADQTPAGPEGPWQEVAPGIYRLVAEPDAVTIGLIVGETGALLVDCGSTPEQGARLRESVAAVTDVPLVGVVVTHEHRDHWFGLAAFDDLDSWGHEMLEDRITDAGVLREAEGLGLTPEDLRLPKKLFSIAAAVDLGNRLVEIVHLGHAHTLTDAVVHVPDAGVLFAGDLVELPHPLMEPESSPRGWPATLNMIIGMVKADTIVVPGHGDVTDRETVVQQLGALAQLPYEAERLVREGVRFEEAEEKGEWLLPWDRIKEGVRTAYAEMSTEGVRPHLPLA